MPQKPRQKSDLSLVYGEGLVEWVRWDKIASSGKLLLLFPHCAGLLLPAATRNARRWDRNDTQVLGGAAIRRFVGGMTTADAGQAKV
jgi:hypothetical protein